MLATASRGALPCQKLGLEVCVVLDAENRRNGLRRERIHASAQFVAGRFENPSGLGPDLEGAKLPVLAEFFFKKGRREPAAPLPLERPHAIWQRPSATGLRATWLGHSTVLLELDGRRVLTDPVFGERASPVSFAGPKRFHAVPAELHELPPLDVVLLSHDHYDHLCHPTMQAIARSQVPIITALGVGRHLERFGVDPARITELDWHESAEVGGLRFSATPAQHFSGRGLGDRNQTLWASWVIQSERRKVFFSGDTGLTTEFEAIGRTHGPFDLVLLEVGAYHPAWGTIHLGPENALSVFEMLGGGTLLPVHWGTFNLALHAWDEPAETLLQLAAARGAHIVTPKLGAAFEPEHVEGPTPWWRELAGGSAEPRQLIAPRFQRGEAP
jgi:L-ascorbate metabolism protein UlaG (beta-lactamase superfamily)